MKTRSLRMRLFLIILGPLMVLALAVGTWRVGVAQSTAQELFDRNLMFTALAVSRDVARSDGDALSSDTEKLLSETAGGPVRYHVYGPDGVLVTGYAVPPIAPGQSMNDEPFIYSDGLYRGKPVRILRMKDEAAIDGWTGLFTITVWQDFDARNAFVWALGMRSAGVILTLLLAVALLVWFGVRVGLKPLTDLEDAISRRSPEDLSPIRRAVPDEVRGLTSRLNALFVQVGSSMDAQAAFVSDAAHQLRNPIAGLRALGEAIQSATTLPAAHARADDLVAAAARAGDLANRLLTLERARAESGNRDLAWVDMAALSGQVVVDFREEAQKRGIELAADQIAEVQVMGDAVMLREALTNLVDNALVHGGPKLTRIEVSLAGTPENLELTVANNGATVPAEAIPKIISRFGQAEAGQGSGLGLSIADAVARRHGGSLSVHERNDGFAVTLLLPQVQRPAA